MKTDCVPMYSFEDVKIKVHFARKHAVLDMKAFDSIVKNLNICVAKLKICII